MNSNVLKSEQLYKWQQDIVNELKIPNDQVNGRTINWVVGGTGKTALIDYCIFHNLANVFSTEKDDFIGKYIIERKSCRDFIFDYSMSSTGKVSYAMIESVKDGIVICSKGTKLITTPNVYVFANFYPDESKMSKDRWNIIEI